MCTFLLWGDGEVELDGFEGGLLGWLLVGVVGLCKDRLCCYRLCLSIYRSLIGNE